MLSGLAASYLLISRVCVVFCDADTYPLTVTPTVFAFGYMEDHLDRVRRRYGSTLVARVGAHGGLLVLRQCSQPLFIETPERMPSKH